MATNDLIMTIGKVIIATAWADGIITDDEVNSLKDLLWRLPAVNAREWEELEIYLDAPVDDEERERLVAQLHQQIDTADARNLAINAIDNMVSADGVMSDSERAVVAEIKRSLDSTDVGMWGSLSRMLIGRRSKVAAAAPNREVYLNDFVRNRVYYKMRQQLSAENKQWEIPDEELRRLGLAGGLLALIAQFSDGVSDEERAAMESALRSAWSLSPESAAFVVEIALANGERLDLFRLTREFSEVTTAEERQAFLNALFTVAAADEKASFDEIEQLRLVATGFKLSHQEFIDAKLTVPRDQRST
jgi:uncharacterized tellurite resistance protein B-like protein